MGAINILERGHRLLACVENIRRATVEGPTRNVLVKQEPTEGVNREVSLMLEPVGPPPSGPGGCQIRRLIAALATSVPLLSSAAQPSAAVNEAAKRALASQDYPRVVNTYANYTDLPPIALYRLSIAHAKMGDPVKAFELLEFARQGAPSGSFASNPQRLQSFTQGLLADCEALGAIGCTPASARPSAPSASTPVATSTAPAPTAVADVAQATSAPPSTPTLATAAPTTASALSTPAADTSVSSASNHNELAIKFALGLIGLIALVGYWRSSRCPRKAKRSDTLAQHYASTKAVLASTNIHSPLHAAMAGTLALLEQEIGREFLSQNGDSSKLTSTDSQQHSIRKKFDGKPILISQASPEEVTALFQGVRW